MDIVGLKAVWSSALEKMRSEIGEEQADLWLKPIEIIDVQGAVLRVKIPNKFFSSWIRQHYQKRLTEVISDSLGSPISMDYEISQNLEDIAPTADPIPDPRPQSDFSSSEFNPRYTFSNFVVGDSNRFAHATAQAVAKTPGTQFNPYFIYGGVGLGKTHLLNAIGNSIRGLDSRARVLYISSEQFVNEFIDAIRHGNPDGFRAKFRTLDCLLIDDIQFLISKEKSEEEFLHTFNSLFNARKQLVISSDRSPRDMTRVEQRLISRFEWGVVADIKPPDLETRIAILRKKAEMEGFSVPEDVVVFVASSVKTNIRTLEGCLIRLKAFSLLTRAPLTVDMAKDILKDSIGHEDLSPVRAETIQRVVAYKYSLDIKDMKSQQRSVSVAVPRQIAMYLSCVMTDLSLKEIGRAFGGKDHTTVLHARAKIKKKLDEDPFFLEMVNKLKSDISAVENQ
ncbi:MAG: chromosomal replication initiator protein DnaA [Elusimicrobiota bacterium]